MIHPSQLHRADHTLADSGVPHMLGPSVALINAIHADPVLMAILGRPGHADVRRALEAAHGAYERAGG